MPPWAVSVPRCIFASRRTAIERITSPFGLYNAAKSTNLRIRPGRLRGLRCASTQVSPSAINYRPNVPPQNKELYDALSGLEREAEQWVNLSRLQLALRGLSVEGDSAVTRVAVLGLDSQVGAQKLARLLVVDPLGEEEGWEKELQGDEGAVLLRFGDESDAHAPNPLYKILSVPSRLLSKHNLEILVSTLNDNLASTITASKTDSSQDAVLVPKLQAPSARSLPVPYPVHKTLILGQGLDSAIQFGKFTADSSIESLGDMVKVAIDLPPPSKEVESSENSLSTQVNIESGTEAISALRKSVQNSTIYEKKWFASNLPVLTRWLTQNLQNRETTTLKPAHRALITSLLDSIEGNLTRADVQYHAHLTSPTSTAQAQIQSEMLSVLSTWAEKGHEELRDALDEAFHSRSWSRLKWWKLWWRVDDVGMVLEEMLERRWLVKTEKEAVYLAGRMKQAGFADDVQHILPSEEESLPLTSEPNVVVDTKTTPLTTNSNTPTSLSTTVTPSIPWPLLIPTTRATLLTTTIPPLQALAQNLLLQTLSTTSLSSALSALLYISVSSVTLFEASAVAALGLTLSLKRMQKLWEGARENWVLRVREEGRQILKGVEGSVGRIVRGRKIEIGDRERVERKKAREAVGRVRELLRKL